VTIGGLSSNRVAGLHDLAAELRVGRHTIQRALRIHGRTSYRKLQGSILRDELVRRVAAEPTLSIKEIAAGLGYEHGRSLSRRFRQLTGQSPTARRRKRLDMKSD
jgi:AraC-like DNA-binding protein